MAKYRSRLVVSVTLPADMVADMDNLIELLRKNGESVNRSKFVENTIGYYFASIVEEVQYQKEVKAKESKED